MYALHCFQLLWLNGAQQINFFHIHSFVIICIMFLFFQIKHHTKFSISTFFTRLILTVLPSKPWSLFHTWQGSLTPWSVCREGRFSLCASWGAGGWLVRTPAPGRASARPCSQTGAGTPHKGRARLFIDPLCLHVQPYAINTQWELSLYKRVHVSVWSISSAGKLLTLIALHVFFIS